MSDHDDLDRFLALACEYGAQEAQVIHTRTIVTAAWVRLKCQFGCGGYNQRRTCPPHTPTPEETQRVIDCYRRAILVHCTGEVRPTAVVSQLEREVFVTGFYKALALGEGPCRLCQTCSPERCQHPREARPSMEACGIDVFATVRANGWPIHTLPDRAAPHNLYGLVLVD
jgi:predicted metal-binding protein